MGSSQSAASPPRPQTTEFVYQVSPPRPKKTVPRPKPRPAPEVKPPPPSPLFNEPWRNLSWGNRQEDLQYVENYMPENRNIRHLRVLLYGPVGAGKSSFINSVSNVLRRRMTIPAAASATSSDKSFTKKYETHKIPKGRGQQKTFYPVVFCDLMGLEESCGVMAEDIQLAMKGRIKDGYKFNETSPLSEEDSNYNPAPAPDDKVHVLVCVLSANAPEIKSSVLQKMSDVRETASSLGIPQLAILTNIDTACPETDKNTRNVYKSKHLKNKMKQFSSAVGIPLNCIFPVKNYSYEIDLDGDMDTLILSALKHMINFGDDFIEKM